MCFLDRFQLYGNGVNQDLAGAAAARVVYSLESCIP